MRTCSPSSPLNLQPKARPTFLSTGTFPFGVVHVASSRTTASSSAPSFPTSYMSFLVFEKSPPAPIIQAATVVWSALTTQWPKCWLWSSTNAKTIGMRSCRTWSPPTTIRAVPPLAWPPTRFTWAGSRASLSRFSTAPRSPAIRAWPATTSNTATWRLNANSAPTILFARCMP